ncbi:MAG: BamA/TamA family outer membrane protein [Balneolaceae bacterium]|nr:BamA/TamA family outer membrane protein [Balneolaceae bacterium]
MRFTNLQYLLAVIACWILLSSQNSVFAQNNSNSQQEDKVVRIIRFVGNDNVKENTLEGLIRTQTNREFLGIPRFTPWYFIYKLTGRFGEEPSLLDPQKVATDIERIQRYYTTIGYLEAKVDTNIVEFKEDKIEVSFLIEEGQRSYINTVAYTGMPSFEKPQKLETFYQESDLLASQINDSTYQVDSPYLQNKLSEERLRIINFLRNNGYASVQRDSVLLQAKRTESDSTLLDLLFLINAEKKYTFGDVYISLAGPDDEFKYQEKDTVKSESKTLNNRVFYLQKEKSAQSKFSLLTDQILFKPGDTFNNELYVRSINKFQNLGMLNIRQFGLSESGTQADYSKDNIPVSFDLQTLPKHSVNLNLFGLRRYGYGSGAGITYNNNNLFGKAENLQLGVNGSFEYVSSQTLRDIAPDSTSQRFESRFFRSIETRLEYALPRLTFPFSALEENLFFTNARTRYSLSYGRSNQLLFDINSDVRFNLRYEVQHNSRFSSFLDLIELDVLDTDPSPQFRASLEEEFGQNSIAFQRILEDFRPQVSSTVRYTFRSQRTDLIKRNFGYFSEYSIAFSGNIPHLIDRYITTPGTVEGNIPSPAKVSKNSLAYSRFIKTTADYRRYIPISNNGVFAYRGFAGIALPYGQSTSIPLNQRFFAGGSNDIRGWNIFSLGPGELEFEDVVINGGEIKLVAQTEARQQIIEKFLSANWIGAWFTDAGNVWYGPRTEIPSNPTGGTNTSQQQNLTDGKFYFDEFYKQIAVGSGLGLRLDWNYVVVRFDFAFRIHDLQKGWFENKKLFFSFGIGHSF